VIPAGVMRVVMSGQLPGGELWNTGYWIDHAPVDNADANAKANTLWGIWTDNTAGKPWNELRQHWFHNAVGFERLTVYGYSDTSGHASHIGVKTGTLVGSSLGHSPDQMAVVASLRTEFAGARRRGRMYFPALGHDIGTASQFDGGQTSALCTAIAGAFAASNTAIGFPAVVISFLTGDLNEITQVKIDQRPDIQRRRANRQARGTSYTVDVP
jgi:hypothetical protein